MTDGQDSGTPLCGEDLLAAAMGEQVGEDRLADCTPQERQEMRSWEEFIRHCRQSQSLQVPASGPQAGPGNVRLIQSILRRTTREDLSYRGDLHLLTAFVRRRCDESPVLRVAAALLLIQLFFAPAVMAYLAMLPKDPEPQLQISIDTPVDPGLRESVEEPLEAFLPDRPWDLALDDLSRDLRREEVRALARDLSLDSRASAIELEAGLSLTDQLMHQRLQPDAPSRDPLIWAQSAWDDPFVRALSIEAALDVLSRGSLGLDPEGQVQALLVELPLGGNPAERLLLGAALARTDAHGALSGLGHEHLSRLRRIAIRHPLLEAGPRRGGPFGSHWKQALQQCLAGRGISSGVAHRLSLAD